MKPVPITIGDVLALHIKQVHGTQKEAAKTFGCSLSFLNQVVHGERRPTEEMLSAVGMKHVEVWVPIGKEVSGYVLRTF